MELKINNKFVAYNGCIGRRDYILTTLYLAFIVVTLTMPLTIWQLTHSANTLEMYNVKALIASAPIFVQFCYVLGCMVSLAIGSGMIIRRLTDMFGERTPKVYVLTALYFLLSYLWLISMNPITTLGMFFSFIFAVVFICVPGKITGQLPPDSIKRFNWGAFWGTWIWGLFNRSYITLLMLPLMFTPFGIYFAILCGMKGNEWAYEKDKTVDVATFHKGQKHQAIGWNIFASFVIFILPFLIIFLISAYTVTSAIKNPDAKNDNLFDKMESFIESYYDNQFEEYSLDVDENRFYIDPRVWVGLTFDERYNLLKAASTLSSVKKKQSDDPKFENYNGYSSSEMEITKIYSSYNGEILGEYNMEAFSDVRNFRGAFNAAMKMVRFNTTPELPQNDDLEE